MCAPAANGGRAAPSGRINSKEHMSRASWVLRDTRTNNGTEVIPVSLQDVL